MAESRILRLNTVRVRLCLILTVGFFLTGCSGRSCLFHADWYPEWKETKTVGFDDDTYRIEIDGQMASTWPVKGRRQELVDVLFAPPGSTKKLTEHHIRTLRIGPNSYLVEINGEIQPWPVKTKVTSCHVLNQRP